MFLLLAALFEILFFTYYVHHYITIGIALVYALSYFADPKEYTGERRWEAFRRLRIWGWMSPVEYHYAPGTKSELGRSAHNRRLFVFIPCSTPSPLFWGIGLHGNQTPFTNAVHYILPPPFMWIPFVRDILIWSGAVTYSIYDTGKSLNLIISDLLDAGRSVCYSPSGFGNTTDDLEKEIHTAYPSDEVLSFCIEKDIQLIPVITQGEHERYTIWTGGRILQWIQRQFHVYTDYYFPLCYWLRIFSRKRPPPLHVMFGAPLTCSKYSDATLLRRSLRDFVDGTVIVTQGDKLIKPQ